jgi:hypothetical protein
MLSIISSIFLDYDNSIGCMHIWLQHVHLLLLQEPCETTMLGSYDYRLHHKSRSIKFGWTCVSQKLAQGCGKIRSELRPIRSFHTQLQEGQMSSLASTTGTHHPQQPSSVPHQE